MKTALFVVLAIIMISPIEKYGKHYKRYHDFESLSKVVELMGPEADTNYVKKILGVPIDMGFEYRYLTDSISENKCPVGAAFHLNKGKISNKFMTPFCE
jgi:hypothetical protein